MPTARGGVVLVQSTVPEFRRDFIAILRQRDPDIRIIAGREGYEPTVRLFDGAESSVTTVGNSFLLGRRLLWQRGVVLSAVAASTAVLELNPRTLTTWWVLLLRRIARRPTVGWSHVWPRSGPGSRTVPVRRLMWRLADVALLYTHEQRSELLKMRVRRPAVIAPNAVHSRVRVSPASGSRRHIVQVGRLVGPKKPALLVRAYAQALEALPDGTELWFVGDGPLQADLDGLSASLGITNRVRFFGPLHDPEALKPIFDECLVACSPGYAGLSITQAFAFGLPCIIADREPHAPEISLADVTNSRYFSADSVASLRDALIGVFEESTSWREAAERISQACLDQYSAEAMADGFFESITLAERAKSASN